MAKIEYHICDIDKCENKAGNLNMNMQVIFTTDQTEGRPVKPYFSYEKIDLCEKCFQSILDSGHYIIGSGAQGYNKYIKK